MRFWTVPNILTLLRIMLIPVFVLLYVVPFSYHLYAATAVFLIAAITDWFDGFVARWLNQASPFGAFLDPVADKLMVTSALLLLVSAYYSFWITLAALIIVAREVTVSALREWMAELGKRATVKVSMIGKIKTTMQMVALVILLSQPPVFNWVVILGIVCLYAAVVLTIWSMCYYLSAACKEL